ncbi:MAG: hypothetical protein WCP58_06210 [bacterium]
MLLADLAWFLHQACQDARFVDPAGSEDERQVVVLAAFLGQAAQLGH